MIKDDLLGHPGLLKILETQHGECFGVPMVTCGNCGRPHGKHAGVWSRCGSGMQKHDKNALINAVGNAIGLDICPCSFRGVSALGQQIPVSVMPKNFPPAPTIASDNTILNLSFSIPQDRMKPWLGTHSLLRKMTS